MALKNYTNHSGENTKDRQSAFCTPEATQPRRGILRSYSVIMPGRGFHFPFSARAFSILATISFACGANLPFGSSRRYS
jgi:hypothetical protein